MPDSTIGSKLGRPIPDYGSDPNHPGSLADHFDALKVAGGSPAPTVEAPQGYKDFVKRKLLSDQVKEVTKPRLAPGDYDLEINPTSPDPEGKSYMSQDKGLKGA